MTKNKLICIGSIGKPRGLVGEFFLNSFCNPVENIINYIDDIKLIDCEIKLEYIKKTNSKFVSKIKHINNVENIKDYTNKKLYIYSHDLPALSSEEIYWHDLIGMLVIDINKDEILGKVEGLNNFGSDDCLIVTPTEESVDDKERLIPMIKEVFIISIENQNKIVKVNWQSDY